MKCARKGCKNELLSPLMGPVKYCKDPMCVLERQRAAGRGYYRRERKKNPDKYVYIPKETIADAPLRPRRRVSPDMSFDKGAKFRNFDRGTREGFRRYYEANPILFAHVFPGVTVAAAWRGMAR